MSKMIGQSPAFLQVMRAAQMVSATDAPVLVLGESGTGKERLAKAIHEMGRNPGSVFLSVRCTGVDQESLRESFTANDLGTIFLDEVGELSLDLQNQLLSMLEQAWENSGSNQLVRIIASSANDLSELVEKGQFREDLYYRLHVVPLNMPSLRERRDDVPLMVKQFTHELAKYHGRKPPRYSVTAKNLLKQYAWPGNVRELHNFCERMVIMMAGGIVQPEDMPSEMRRKERANAPLFLLPDSGVDLVSLEGDIIRQAVTMSGGNRSKAARLLGLTRDTLLYRMQKHGINAK